VTLSEVMPHARRIRVNPPFQMLTRGRVAFGLAVWWLAQPLAETLYYQHELRRGAYPTDADSISIPLFEFGFGWLSVTPLIVLIACWIVRRAASGRFGWATFDSSRRIWCALWTVILSVLAVFELWFAAMAIVDGYALDIVVSGLGAAILLATRAGLCAPRLMPLRG
jgi:hypothetical protein